MELLEPVETLNKRLIEFFGTDTMSSLPIWRIVWSEDQFEHQYGTYEDRTPAGIYIRTVTEVRYLPKYRQWIQSKYILERLVIVPEFQQCDLAGAKLSYEPIYVYEDGKGNPLPPKWEITKFQIELIYAVQYGDHSVARYKDPDSNPEQALENQKKRIDTLMEELYGDESSLMLTTVTGESVIVPRNFEKSKTEEKK